jgi:hemolysin activation/secretion protein
VQTHSTTLEKSAGLWYVLYSDRGSCLSTNTHLKLDSRNGSSIAALLLDQAIYWAFCTLGVVFPLHNASAQSIPASGTSRPPNPIEQTLPTSPPLPAETPVPTSPPGLEVQPTPLQPSEDPQFDVPRFPLERVEIFGSSVARRLFRDNYLLDNSDHSDLTQKQQQVKDAIDLLKQQSTCDLITPSLAQLAASRSTTEIITVPLENCQATFDDLIRLRTAITILYTSNGYITSGAFVLPSTDLNQKVAQIQVVEGELERIEVCMVAHRRNRSAPTSDEPTESPACNSATLQSSYVRSRLNLARSIPLDQAKLELALQLLQLDPLIDRVDAELGAGSSPGRSILGVTIQESFPLDVAVSIDNYQSPSIGSNQAAIEASYHNIIGIGDRFSVQYGITEGLQLYDYSYTIPINPRDGTLTLRYGNNDSTITTDEFDDLDIDSQARTYAISLRQPLVKTPETEFAIGLGFDVRRSQTFILDTRPFSFSEGVEEGRARVSVLRFSQDWVNRNRTRVLAARSQFSFGLDVLDATINDSGTDGTFFAWLGQFQYVQQITPSPLILVTRLNAQLTPDSLLSLERFSFGGADSVRGYAQNQVVADNGIFGSVELRIPLTNDPSRLQIVPFLEAGYAWNNKTVDPQDDFIAGLGLGLRWRVTQDLDLRLDYGLPLIDIADRGSSLQDSGIYFSLRYNSPFA